MEILKWLGNYLFPDTRFSLSERDLVEQLPVYKKMTEEQSYQDVKGYRIFKN